LHERERERRLPADLHLYLLRMRRNEDTDQFQERLADELLGLAHQQQSRARRLVAIEVGRRRCQRGRRIGEGFYATGQGACGSRGPRP
jgi:hypothetical protein